MERTTENWLLHIKSLKQNARFQFGLNKYWPSEGEKPFFAEYYTQGVKRYFYGDSLAEIYPQVEEYIHEKYTSKK